MSARRTCAAEGCGKTLGAINASGFCRSHRMQALHADPEFARRHRERSSERMKALNADPEFARRSSKRMKALHADPEFNPLVDLTVKERADYDVLKKVGYSRHDALRAIGRGDLITRRPAESAAP